MLSACEVKVTAAERLITVMLRRHARYYALAMRAARVAHTAYAAIIDMLLCADAASQRGALRVQSAQNAARRATSSLPLPPPTLTRGLMLLPAVYARYVVHDDGHAMLSVATPRCFACFCRYRRCRVYASCLPRVAFMPLRYAAIFTDILEPLG